MEGRKKHLRHVLCLSVVMGVMGIAAAYGQPAGFTEFIYPVGKLKPTDSVPKLKVGDVAPDFSLPAVAGGKVSLSHLDRYAVELGRPPRTVVGENLGCCDSPLMGLIHAGMMESREHRANILDREYVSVGVGVYVLPDGRAWVTQVFRGELPK